MPSCHMNPEETLKIIASMLQGLSPDMIRTVNDWLREIFNDLKSEAYKRTLELSPSDYSNGDYEPTPWDLWNSADQCVKNISSIIHNGNADTLLALKKVLIEISTARFGEES